MEEVLKKLEEHDQKFDKVFVKLEEHDREFEYMHKKFEEHDGQLDLIARTVAEHTDRLDRIEENMATKDDISKVMGALDEIVGMFKKKDQELVFVTHNVSNLEDRVEVVENDIKQMKPVLGMI